MTRGRRSRISSAARGWAALVAVAFVALLFLGQAREVQQGTPLSAGQTARGQELFAGNCAQCHGADARGMDAAPALTGVVDRLGRDAVEDTIRAGRDVSPPMPAFGGQLTDEEISSVIAYLEALPDEEEREEEPPWRGMPHSERMGRDMMRDGMMNGWWGVWGILWVLIALGVLALLIAGVVWLVHSMATGGRGRPPSPGAGGGSTRDILDVRYARGEIDRDEYVRARQDLGDPVE